MTRRRVLAVDRRGRGSLTVHPHWRLRVAGVAAPSLCDLRVLTARELPAAAGLLRRAGCLDAVGRQESGWSLLLLAWLDLERLAGLAPDSTRPAPGRPVPGPPASGPPASGQPASGQPAPGPPASGQPAPGHPTSGAAGRAASARLCPAGCVEIRWSGPADIRVADRAGACVEVGQLYVDPRFRRHGVGRALVAAAEQHCLAAGQPRLVAALPSDADGGSTPDRALSAAARAGYVRLPGSSGSTTGPAWVWRDLPELSTRSATVDGSAEHAVPGAGH